MNVNIYMTNEYKVFKDDIITNKFKIKKIYLNVKYIEIQINNIKNQNIFLTF